MNEVSAVLYAAVKSSATPEVIVFECVRERLECGVR
jgi:hypothetical protein